jgi:hypothetical protein
VIGATASHFFESVWSLEPAAILASFQRFYFDTALSSSPASHCGFAGGSGDRWKKRSPWGDAMVEHKGRYVVQF